MFKPTVKISLDIKCSILRLRTEKQLLFVLVLTTLPFGLICVGSAGKNCRTYTSSNVHIADCSLLDMSINVPDDLDPGIEVMNLSGNHLANISDRSFERYKESLVALDLSNMSHFKLGNTQVMYDDRSFTGLRKLEYLDISGSCIVKHKFRFPNSLKTLKMDNCELTSLNFSHIKSLEELHAAQCNLIDLPILHRQTPLKFLDLRLNNLTKLRLETIAPFCQMKQLRLQIPNDEGLHNSKAYCQCMLIDSWLTKTGVEHDQLNCTKDKSSKNEENCSLTPSETVMQLRRECLALLSANSITAVKTNWMLIGIVVLGVFVFLIPSFLYSRSRLRARRRKKRIAANNISEPVQEEEYEEEIEEEVYHHYDYEHGYYHH